MEISDALALIGARADQGWTEIRSAYRQTLLQAHPDLNPAEGSAERVDQLVAAYRILRSATANGTRPLPTEPVRAVPGPDEYLPVYTDDEMVVLYARPGRAFDQIRDAAESLGQISYLDPDANLLQITISQPGWAPATLTVELEDTGPITTAAFTLDSITGGIAPPIGDLVEILSQTLRRPHRAE